MLDVWGSIQMPNTRTRLLARCEFRQTMKFITISMSAGATGSSAASAYRTCRAPFSCILQTRAPYRRPAGEHAGGRPHGPERMFNMEMAFDDEGIVKSMKMRALDKSAHTPVARLSSWVNR